MAIIEMPKDAYGRTIPLDTGTLYKKNGGAVIAYHYDFDPRGKEWYVETDEGSYSVSEFLLDRDDSWEKLLADLKMGASRVHHPECAYFGRDENDCDQCEAVCSFACKKIAFGDIESRIRKLMGEGQ